MRRIALIVAVAMVMTVLGSSIAAADPVNSKNAEVFTLTCSNGQTFQVVVTGGIVGHIVGSTGNIIPVKFTFTATGPNGEVSEKTEPVGKGKKLGSKGDLITCETAPETFVDPEIGEITFVITVEGFFIPRRQ